MVKYFSLILLYSFFGFFKLEAQSNSNRLNQLTSSKDFVFKSEWAISARIYSNGFGLGYTLNNYKTYYKTKNTFISFSGFNHIKEKKQNYKLIYTPTRESSRNFIFGKINSFYSVTVGKSIKRYYSEKSKYKGVKLAVIFGGGVSLGLLKPYYTKVREIDPETNQIIGIKSIKYSEETKNQLSDASIIFGGGSFYDGIWETKLIPGVFGNIGLQFDFGKYDYKLKAIEFGFTGQIFTENIIFMTNQTSKPYLFNLYLGLQIGRKKLL